MIINPTFAIEQGWITHPDCTTIEDWKERKLINPNAIDFTLDRLFLVKPDPSKVATITETYRSFHEVYEIDGHTWTINPGSLYDGTSSMHVTLPEGVCAMLINRSTFNRCGVHLNSGLYDSGYDGAIGFTLYSRSSGHVATEAGTRVGQIMFIQSDSAGLYNGMYNGGQGGQHWTETL